MQMPKQLCVLFAIADMGPEVLGQIVENMQRVLDYQRSTLGAGELGERGDVQQA